MPRQQAAGSSFDCQLPEAASTSTNSPARFGRDRIAGVTAVLHVKLDGFSDIVQRLVASIALADTSRQSRHADNVTAIFFLL